MNTSVVPNWYNTIYDPKEGRCPKVRVCPLCNRWDGHKLDCPGMTMEAMGREVEGLGKQNDLARGQKNRYWVQLQRAVGKVAVLKNENNKLRKANLRYREQLRDKSMDNKTLSSLQAAIDARNVISCVYKDIAREVEPLAIKNEKTLVAWQTGGATSGGRAMPCWFQCDVSDVKELKETGRSFIGTPPGFDAEKYK